MNNGQDQADKALAEEFSFYMSSVAREIVQPVQDAAYKAEKAIGEAAVDTEAKLKHIILFHQEEFSTTALNLVECLSKSTQEISRIGATIATGHEKTRSQLTQYAKQQIAESREEMKLQSVELFKAFKSEVLPQLEDLAEPYRLVAQETQELSNSFFLKVEQRQSSQLEKISSRFRWLLGLTAFNFVMLMSGLAILIYYPV